MGVGTPKHIEAFLQLGEIREWLSRNRAPKGTFGVIGIRHGTEGYPRFVDLVVTRKQRLELSSLSTEKDFTRTPFQCALPDVAGSDTANLLRCAREMEVRAVTYYQEAAAKLKALPEVARELKRLAKKRQAHVKQLEAL